MSIGYAVDTKVPVKRTREEIEALVMKHKAENYATFNEATGAAIAFAINGYRIVFRLPLPKPKDEQDCRSRWRGLLLCIKAKFESINRGVETFEEAFMAHVMGADGRTLADHAAPRLKEIAAGKVPLLPAPRGPND